jgi:hypothetical protein
MRNEVALQGLAAVALGAAAWLYFAARPPALALVGTTPIDEVVPPVYQASAFFAFGAHGAAALVERRGERARRVALLAITSAIAVARLTGAIPLSGHAVFLAAAAAFDLRQGSPGRALRLAVVAAALVVTAAFKLFVWHDAAWLVASLVVGAAIGATCRCAACS